ncbi:hypothetical protein AMK59_3907, partial [Oryctes borbonicus]
MFAETFNVVLVSTYLLFALFIRERAAVQITDLRVPERVAKGTPALLDCEYTLDADVEKGFVLKWYFDTSTLVYQWILGRKPDVFGMLKGQLDLDYSMSNETTEPNYRALYVRNASIVLSGNYSCVVSTYTSEDKQTKRMLVFELPENVSISQNLSNDFIPQGICTADRVFPLPKVTIFADKRKLDTSVVALNDYTYGDGSYSIKAVANISTDSFVDKISCEVYIAEGNYLTRVEKIYYPLVFASSAK